MCLEVDNFPAVFVRGPSQDLVGFGSMKGSHMRARSFTNAGSARGHFHCEATSTVISEWFMRRKRGTIARSATRDSLPSSTCGFINGDAMISRHVDNFFRSARSLCRLIQSNTFQISSGLQNKYN
mmetsp:Transcript_1493/g.2928  ORF Transcript_1493/g.2928 Transcript_1493/m.2928 type:complete len:125 (-) Transcript_1493:582-956(-)